MLSELLRSIQMASKFDSRYQWRAIAVKGYGNHEWHTVLLGHWCYVPDYFVVSSTSVVLRDKICGLQRHTSWARVVEYYKSLVRSIKILYWYHNAIPRWRRGRENLCNRPLSYEQRWSWVCWWQRKGQSSHRVVSLTMSTTHHAGYIPPVVYINAL